MATAPSCERAWGTCSAVDQRSELNIAAVTGDTHSKVHGARGAVDVTELNHENIILAAACIYALAGCANTELRDSLGIQDPTVLQTGFGTQQSTQAGAAVEPWGSVYGQIEKPREVLVLLQARLDQLDHRKDNYFGYKDQCWIDVAKARPMQEIAGAL